jgi:hypothetical protein
MIIRKLTGCDFMIIHIAQASETIEDLSREYNISQRKIQADNYVDPSGRLVKGSAIVIKSGRDIRYPMEIMARISGHVKGYAKGVNINPECLIYGGFLFDGKNNIVSTGVKPDMANNECKARERYFELGYRPSDMNTENINCVVNELVCGNYDGLVVYSEKLRENKGYLRSLINECHKVNKKVVLDNGRNAPDEISAYFDKILVTYESFNSIYDMGTIEEKTEENLNGVLKYVRPEQLILGISPRGIIVNKYTKTAHSIGHKDALRLAYNVNGNINYDEAINRAYFNYTAGNGLDQSCYFHDPRSILQIIKYSAYNGFGGICQMDMSCEFKAFWAVVEYAVV